jgi:hypothetical protein
LAARKTDRDVIGFELRKEYESIIKQKAKFGKLLEKDKQEGTLDHFLNKET